jgi:hypothetical protein
MNELIQALPTLIGVVIGALASYLATTASERNRWKREQETRWDENRAQVYADYGYIVKSHYEFCKRLAAAHGMPTLAAPIDPNGALDELARTGTERAAMWERVLLMGSPDAVTAARAWHRKVWELELFARGLRDKPDEWRAADDAAMDARTEFYNAARQDLGIKSGQLPDRGHFHRSG